MKNSSLFKNLFLSTILLSTFSAFGSQQRLDSFYQSSSRSSISSQTDFLEGQINTGHPSYIEVEKAYVKQVTSPLTLDQTFETTSDDDEYTHPNPDKLNLTQLWAIYGYTMGDYENINKTLRSSNPKAKLEKNIEMKNQVIVIRAALQKMKSFKGIVFRGTRFKPDFLAKHLPGEVVAYPGFVSTSKSREASEDFVKNVLLVIHSKSGKSIKNYSQVAREDEILFDHNTKFKVLKRKKARVESIPNPVVDEIELQEI